MSDLATELRNLNEIFRIPGLRFATGRGDLIRAVIETPIASGEVYLQGAHVTQFQPHGHSPVLWVSQQSYSERGKPIRGGVPICFPWFGANAKDPQAPAHGLARIAAWEVLSSSRSNDGGIAIEFTVTIAEFRLVYRVRFGVELELMLTVEALPDAINVKTFEAALHSYFAVSDIHHVHIEGLEDYSFLDKVGELTQRPATGEPISFSGETDRIYLETNAVCRLQDPLWERLIKVRQVNSRSTIVWNPWIDKSRRMPDFGDDEWPGMVCIESANVGDQAVTIEPGQMHTLIARIAVESI